MSEADVMSHGARRKAGQSAALMVTPCGGLCVSYSMKQHGVGSGTTTWKREEDLPAEVVRQYVRKKKRTRKRQAPAGFRCQKAGTWFTDASVN